MTHYRKTVGGKKSADVNLLKRIVQTLGSQTLFPKFHIANQPVGGFDRRLLSCLVL